MTTSAERRVLPVPEGLAGERVDAALARLFGLSRTRAAELIAEGNVVVDGAEVAKSDRVVPGALLEVTIPAATDPLTVVPAVVEGIRIIHDDDSIVVIDKPVGVAVHPSPGRGSGSPPAAPRSGRASSNGSTWGPRASW